MTDITPPPELIEDWIEIAKSASWKSSPNPNVLCTLAAQWGADQELEACCEWIYRLMDRGLEWSMDLRTARRPKPPSLKEQALDRCNDYIDPDGTIRRALEQLPE